MGAETNGINPFSQPDVAPNVLLIDAARPPEALTYTRHQLIPHFAIRIEPLLAAALTRGRIHRRPIFHFGGHLIG